MLKKSRVDGKGGRLGLTSTFLRPPGDRVGRHLKLRRDPGRRTRAFQRGRDEKRPTVLNVSVVSTPQDRARTGVVLHAARQDCADLADVVGRRTHAVCGRIRITSGCSSCHPPEFNNLGHWLQKCSPSPCVALPHGDLQQSCPVSPPVEPYGTSQTGASQPARSQVVSNRTGRLPDR